MTEMTLSATSLEMTDTAPRYGVVPAVHWFLVLHLVCAYVFWCDELQHYCWGYWLCHNDFKSVTIGGSTMTSLLTNLLL